MRGRSEPGTSWPLPLSIALGLSLLHGPIHGLFDATSRLAHFRDRAIGITTLQGIDATGYSEHYVRLQTLLVVLVVGLYLALRWLRGKLDTTIDPARIAVEHRWIARASEIWIALALVELVRRDEFIWVLQRLVGHGVILVFLLVLVREWLRRSGSSRLGALLADRSFVVGSLFLPLSAVFAYWVFAGRPLDFSKLPMTLWFVILLALWGLGVSFYAWWLGRSARLRGGFERRELASLHARTVLATAPLLLIPGSLPLANELQQRFVSTSPEALARLGILLLVVVSIALFALTRRIGLPWSTQQIVHGFHFPMALATCASFKTHSHHWLPGQLDYFHLGEVTLPTQQWLNFGSIPQLDLRLAHTFSDMAYQMLYSMVHGYRGMDMLIWWIWLPEVVAVVLVYFLLARVISPGFAFLVVALLPVLGLAPEYYAVVLGPALVLGWALRNPTALRFACVWAALLLMGLWRLDFGLACGVAFVVVIAGYLWAAPAERWRAVLGSFAWVAGSALVLFGVPLLWSGRAALETVALFFESYSYRPITRTRSMLIEQYDFRAVLQYYLLPAVSVAYLAYFAVVRLLRGRSVSRHQIVMVFLAAFSLIVSVRSLERHSLVEGLNPYLFLLLIALLPFFFSRGDSSREGTGARTFFLTVTVLSWALVVPNSLFGAGRHQMPHLLEPGPVFAFHTWQAGEERVASSDENHRPIVEFLRDELRGDETFFDFTNSPLLYLLADKRFPTYVIPNLIQTAEPIQEDVVRDLTELLEADRLPFVIFRQGHSFWDRTDDVPNEIRSYRIAEFIYRHYEPLAAFGRYEVWSRPGREVETLASADPVLPEEADSEAVDDVPAADPSDPTVRRFGEGYPEQDFYLGRLPYVWANFDPLDSVNETAELETLMAEPTFLAPGDELVLEFDPAVDKSRGNYLHLRVRADLVEIPDELEPSEAERALTSVLIHYDDSPQHAFAFEIVPQTAENAIELQKMGSIWAHDLESFPLGERTIFRATGSDPYAHRVFDLGSIPPFKADEEVFVYLRYRSSFSGPLQLFSAFDDQPFQQADHWGGVVLQTEEHGTPAGILLRASPPRAAARLTDLRFDILEDSLFETVSAHLLRREVRYDDYLVRLSTQWRWNRGPVSRFVLKSSGPVEIESVVLRGGD